jgi:DNA polymerase-3 subunit beta
MQQIMQEVLPPPPTPTARPAEFTVNKKDLLKELSELQKVVERTSTVPIVANVLIQATGNVLALTATDLDLSLRTTCPARVKNEGVLTAPAHKLYEYVRLLADGEITIRMLDNYWLQIKSGRSHTKMVGMAPDSFPKLPLFPSDSAVKLDSHGMRSLIARTIFAVSTVDSRYVLNGALMVLNPEGVTMVATDGNRLAYAEWSKPQPIQPSKAVIGKKALLELGSLLNTNSVEQIQFAQNDSTLFFAVGNRLLTSRQITGTFPNYAAVMPTGNNDAVVLSRDELLIAIQRVSQFSDERWNSVRFRLEQNQFRVSSSSSDAGESEDVLRSNYTGDPKVIAFNAQYLLDFLKAVDSSNVRFEFKDGQLACEFKPEDSPTKECTYRCVVMPLRG